MITYVITVNSICIVFLLYLLYRNNKVYRFRNDILDHMYYSDIDWDKWLKARNIYTKYSYDDMVFSFKPIKLESWFTEEEIKLLGYERDIPNR